MYRESSSSPSGSGALAGSHCSFSVVRSKRASMERWAAEISAEGAREACSEFIGTSCRDGDALTLPSLSRSRSTNCS